VKGALTRAKYIDAASALFQSRGYHGVGLAELIEVSGAPKGSFYFHFEGGKEELAIATIFKSREDVQNLLLYAFERAKSAEHYVERIGKALAQWLKSSNFTGGCAVASMTLEAASSSDAIALACRDSYRTWIDLIHSHLSSFSDSNLAPASEASAIMSAFEGAIIQCRCERSVMPMKNVTAYLTTVQRAVAESH
jgi:TetR/AcrR family transcriptional regulator, lmrAB and yxaGH operons repressor